MTVTEQLDLFPVADRAGRARRSDPSTSTEAACLEVFAEGGRYTTDELCACLPNVYPPTLKSAVSRLAGRRLIVDTGERRPSNRDRASIVWTRRAAS